MNDLSTLMRSRVESEHPDLAALVSGSIRRGRRIRRVRYAGAGLATAAVVVGVGVGVAALPGGHTSATELQPATGGPQSASGTLRPMTRAQQLKAVFPGAAAQRSHGTGTVRGKGSAAVPFSIELHGWSCGAAMDDKLTCAGPKGESAEIVWRPTSSYQEWTGDPDKGGTIGVLTSTPHGHWFVTLQGDAATSLHDLHALADSLVWKRS